jgi:hypothetical protein
MYYYYYDPLVIPTAQEELERERRLRSSHVVEGCGDALKSEIEKALSYQEENPYAEMKKLTCKRSLGPSHVEDGGGDRHKAVSEVRQQNVNQWLIRLQSEVPRIESPFEIRKRQQKERLKDLKHYLNQN